METNMQKNISNGFLKIQAQTADGAFPIEGAVVTVTDGEGRLIASLRTDISGLTETLALEAPESSLSQSPQSETVPYSTYTVVVTRDGYYPIEEYSVPVFDSITSIQRVNMIPFSEFAPMPPSPRPQRVETPGYPSLEGRGERP